MYFNDLVKKVAKQAGTSQKVARQVLNAFQEVVREWAKEASPDEDLRIPKIGRLVVVKRRARKARNPKTGEVVEIPERKTLTFKPSKELAKELNTKSEEEIVF